MSQKSDTQDALDRQIVREPIPPSRSLLRSFFKQDTLLFVLWFPYAVVTLSHFGDSCSGLHNQ